MSPATTSTNGVEADFSSFCVSCPVAGRLLAAEVGAAGLFAVAGVLPAGGLLAVLATAALLGVLADRDCLGDLAGLACIVVGRC